MKVLDKSEEIKREWDEQWILLDNSLFGKICTLYRKQFISRCVKYITNKYFKKKGIYVDCGSGTSESSFRMNKFKRLLIPLDISSNAFKYSKRFNQFSSPINGDMMYLPLKNESINGIWNLGVMEHFNHDELKIILDEYYRVLKKGSYILLFWPPIYGSSEVFLGLIESFVHLLGKKEFKFFTVAEKTHVKSKKQVKKILGKSGFKFIRAHFSIRDLFIHYIVIGQKS